MIQWVLSTKRAYKSVHFRFVMKHVLIMLTRLKKPLAFQVSTRLPSLFTKLTGPVILQKHHTAHRYARAVFQQF